MPLIEKPIEIGANDLLRGVHYTYCGNIDVLCSIPFRRKKWKSKFVIISQGCLYIYSDRKAKRTDQSYSFREFESARESDPVNGEDICFCLSDTTAQAPISFSCATNDDRSNWIHQFNTAISEVRGTFLSADSGFGSAETVPNTRQRSIQETEDSYLRYDVVEDKHFHNANIVDEALKDARLPMHQFEGSVEYEKPTNISESNNGFYVNNLSPTNAVAEKKTTRKDQQNKLSPHLPSNAKTKPFPLPKPSRSPALSLDSMLSTQESSFDSIRAGPMSSIQESFLKLSVSGGENPNENNESDSSADSDRTSPKVIYENPETLIKKFERDDYYSEDKVAGKKMLKTKAVGYFAVFPADEMSEHTLCVKTTEGLKYFRIFSQNGKFSLYKQHKMDMFDSIDDLLTFYSINNLPSADYSVKLQSGYNNV